MPKQAILPEERRVGEEMCKILKKQSLSSRQIELLYVGLRFLTFETDRAILANARKIKKEGGSQLADIFQELAHAQLGR